MHEQHSRAPVHASLCSWPQCSPHPPRARSCQQLWASPLQVTPKSLQPTFNLIFPAASVHKAPLLSSNITCLNWPAYKPSSHKPCRSPQFLLLLDSVCHLSLKSHNDFDPGFMSYVQTFAKSLHLFFFTRLFLPIFLYPLDYYSEYYKTHSSFKINIHKLELSKFLQQNYKLSGKVISILPIRNQRLSEAKQPTNIRQPVKRMTWPPGLLIPNPHIRSDISGSPGVSVPGSLALGGSSEADTGLGHKVEWHGHKFWFIYLLLCTPGIVTPLDFLFLISVAWLTSFASPSFTR